MATENAGLQNAGLQNTGPENLGRHARFRLLAINLSLCVLYRTLIIVCFNVCFPLLLYSCNVVNNYVFFFHLLYFALLPQRCNKVCIKNV